MHAYAMWLEYFEREWPKGARIGNTPTDFEEARQQLQSVAMRLNSQT